MANHILVHVPTKLGWFNTYFNLSILNTEGGGGYIRICFSGPQPSLKGLKFPDKV